MVEVKFICINDFDFILAIFDYYIEVYIFLYIDI